MRTPDVVASKGDMHATRRRDLRGELTSLFSVVRRIAPGRTIAQTIAVLLLGLSEGVGLVLLIPVVSGLDSSGIVDTDRVPILSASGLDSISLSVALVALVAVAVVRAVIGRWSQVTGTALRLSVIDELRAACLDAVLRARWEFVLGRRRSDVVEVITVGANRVGVAVDQSIALVTGLVVAITTAVVAVAISPALGAAAIVISTAAAAVMLPAIRSARVLGREFGTRSRAAMATTSDALDALRLVRAHDAIVPWEGSIESGFTDLRDAQLRHARASATASSISTVLLMAVTAGFVYLADRNGMATATLIVLMVVLSRMAGQFMRIANLLPTLGTSLGALRDVEELRASAEAAREAPRATERVLVPDVASPMLELRSVSYRYPDGTQAVRNLSLTVQRGSVTVLVGPTGAGKSTVVDLMLGLLQPTTGTVLVSGQQLIQERLASWRSGVGYVPQDTGLLPGTLRQNLVWSALGAIDDARCWSALDAAAASFARSLPEGLDTVLGDRGVRLSGGEGQRVALARALVREPSILILDEATSSLDVDTESEVLGVVRKLCPATTVVLVTHRISSIAASDVVVRIEP